MSIRTIIATLIDYLYLWILGWSFGMCSACVLGVSVVSLPARAVRWEGSRSHILIVKSWFHRVHRRSMHARGHMVPMWDADLLVLLLHSVVHFFHFDDFVCVIFELVLLRFTMTATVSPAMFINFLFYDLFLFTPTLRVLGISRRRVLFPHPYLFRLNTNTIFTTASAILFIFSTALLGSWGRLRTRSIVVLFTFVWRLLRYIMMTIIISFIFLIRVSVCFCRYLILILFFIICGHVITFTLAFSQAFEADAFLFTGGGLRSRLLMLRKFRLFLLLAFK